MKTLLALTLSLFLAFPAFAANFKEPREATYALLLQDKNPRPHCTAVAIGPDLFLTAAHCIVMDKELQVGRAPGLPLIPVHLVKADPRVDLALLKANSPTTVPHITLAPSMPLQDADILVIGYPLGNPQTVTVGHLQLAKKHNIYISAPIIYGNSGGPVFVEVDGKWYLIGIISRVAGYDDKAVPHLGLATGWSAIKAFLKDLS